MRRNVGRQLLMVLGALVLMTAALPAFAQTPPPAAPTTPTATPGPCDDYAGLTAKMAGCIRHSIDSGATTFFDQIYPFVQGAIGLAMTLAVIVYGIMLSFGAVEKVGRDTYVLMMKLIMVVYFCTNSPMIVEWVTGAMDGAAAAVVSYAPAGGTADNAGTDFSKSTCLQNLITQQSTADPTLPLMAPWLGVDCLIDTVIGIHILPTTTPAHDGTWYNSQIAADDTPGLSRSLLYLFFCCLQTSILGLIMAIIGFIFIYGLLMLIIRCFFVYIAGYMGVTFLAIISPFIIPLILFKETKQYFDKFARMFVSFALQPVIMLVFLIFSISAVDISVYSGTYSIYYAIAGTQSQQPGFKLNQYLSDNQITTKKSATALLVKADSPQPVPQGDKDSGGVLNQLLFAKCTPAAIKADPTLKAKCAFQYPIGLTKTTIAWDKMEAAHQPAITAAVNSDGQAVPGLAISRNVMSSIFFCLMVVFILNGILAIVPMIVGDLLGDLNQSPILGSIGAGKKMGGASGIGNSLSKMVGNPFKQFAGVIGKK